MTKRKLTVLAAVLGLLLVAACAVVARPHAPLSHASERGAAPAPASAPDPAPSRCDLGAVGRDVEVQLVYDPRSCQSWVQALAPSGLDWYPMGAALAPGSAGSADGETLAIACSLSSGGAVLTILDAGSMFYGTALCSQEEANGWVPS